MTVPVPDDVQRALEDRASAAGDHRDFTIVRPIHVDAFELLPG